MVRRKPAAAERVANGARRVDRQLVAEDPGSAQSSWLVRGTRAVVIVVTLPVGGQLGEHPPKSRLAQPADRPGSQAQAVVTPGQVTLPFQLPFEIAQGAHVAGRFRPEPPFQHVDVDIVQAAAGVGLRQLRLQSLQIRDLRHRLDGVAIAERLTIRSHPCGRRAIQSRSQGSEVVSQLRHFRRQVRIGHRLAHQLAELLALLRSERGQHPLGGRLPASQCVDQLVDVLRLLGKELAVLGHEVGKLIGRVFLACMGGKERVEVSEHVLDPLHRLPVG